MFPSSREGVQSCRHPVQGEAGVIWEEAVADGLDPAVPWGSWRFDISGCGISALVHLYSPFPEMEMYRVAGTPSSEGVLQIIIRGN